MYINKDDFVREIPYKNFCKLHNKPINFDVDFKYYLSFSVYDTDGTFNNPIRIFELLSTDKSLVIKEAIYALFQDYPQVISVYTKLDLSQTFSQVRKNKYFKTFIGERQVIFEE